MLGNVRRYVNSMSPTAVCDGAVCLEAPLLMGNENMHCRFQRTVYLTDCRVSGQRRTNDYFDSYLILLGKCQPLLASTRGVSHCITE